MDLKEVFAAYNLDINSTKVEPFGSGLINHTWRVRASENVYILQRINHDIFKKPDDIASNISLMAAHFQQNHRDYLFVAPVKTRVGEEMVFLEAAGYFRMFPFVEGSHTKDVVETPEQAYEAAAQFGKFTRLLRGVTGELKTTLPHFHDLSLRYQHFLYALQQGNKERILESKELIDVLIENKDIFQMYNSIKRNSQFKLRPTHHDTKISNVLFDKNDKGLCVIDLDTVMPGYFISDVGDMMRTYLSPVSEEEIDFSKIEVREDFYRAIVQGYYDEMKEELTDTEGGAFFYAGKFMIYMQALRFLTDYLNNDAYYGAKYEKHNFNRAKNQAILLQKLIEKKDLFVH